MPTLTHTRTHTRTHTVAAETLNPNLLNPNLLNSNPTPAGLQYSRDVTSWLSETHVRFGAGVSVDLQKRIGELHDLVRMYMSPVHVWRVLPCACACAQPCWGCLSSSGSACSAGGCSRSCGGSGGRQVVSTCMHA